MDNPDIGWLLYGAALLDLVLIFFRVMTLRIVGRARNPSRLIEVVLKRINRYVTIHFVLLGCAFLASLMLGRPQLVLASVSTLTFVLSGFFFLRPPMGIISKLTGIQE